MRIHTVISLSLAALSLWAASPASADTKWLDSVESCETFKAELEKFYTSLGNQSELNAAAQVDLKTVLDRACGPRFSSCGFEICKGREGVRPPVGIVSDPLAWLKAPLTCTELTEQFQSRYSLLGRVADVEGNKRAELVAILQAACSERFADCNFRYCSSAPAPLNAEGVLRGIGDVSAMLSTTDQPEPTAVEAEEYDQLVKKLFEKREELIALKKTEEANNQLEWREFHMPPEMQAADADESRAISKSQSHRTPPSRVRTNPTGKPRVAIERDQDGR